MASKILERIMRFKALKWKDGKVLLWGMPSLLIAVYINTYIQKSLERNYGKKEMMSFLYDLGRFQSGWAFKLMSKRFGYAKTLADKIKLIKLHLDWGPFVGLGIYKWVKIDFKNKIFIVHGKSTMAEGYKKFFGIQKEPIDHYMRGQMNVFMEEVLKEKMFTVETKCIATRDSFCEFVIKPVDSWDKKDRLVKSQMVKDFKPVTEMETKTYLYFASKT